MGWRFPTYTPSIIPSPDLRIGTRAIREGEIVDTGYVYPSGDSSYAVSLH